MKIQCISLFSLYPLAYRQAKKRNEHWHELDTSLRKIWYHININIYSVELKWDGKETIIWYDNDMRWIRITVWNGGDLWWFQIVVQINDYLFIDTYKSNKIKIGVIVMTVNDSEMCVRWNNEACSVGLPKITVLR